MSALGPPAPPPRDAIFDDNWSRETMRLSVISHLQSAFAVNPKWRSENPEIGAEIEIVEEKLGRYDAALFHFKSNHGDGVIECTIVEGDWTRIEIVLDGVLVLRAWAELIFEEVELYPDACPDHDDRAIESPGRFSRKGYWVQLDTSRWPGLPDIEGDRFGFESVTIND